jgi:O-acetyl-ADP-ribose deacetylase (regulator of RNase III)
MIEVIKGDITRIAVDVIVNAANKSLMGGGGVDGAIHRSGGGAILEDCRKIVARQGGCKIGEAVITTAGNLPATFVIHTVGPIWNGGKNNEYEKLANCYRNSLKLAVANNCKSISFPAISTGVYRFPKGKAAKIAVSTVKNFIAETSGLEKIVFVCFDDESEQLIQNELG